MAEQALKVLKDVFGYDGFRSGQQQIIESMLDGRDTLVIMPTGGGKSMCYQLPALIRPGTAIVVSPLIALMHDQVTALSQWGINAAYLNSSLDFQVQNEVEQQLLRGELDMLYIAPERLLKPKTWQLLSQCQLALIAIDEAHCVSQWGHDFRPEYLQIAQFANNFPDVPRIALTATADSRTQLEIEQRLELRQTNIFIQGFDRPNIRYRIGQKDRAREQLLAFIQSEHLNDAGIVYCLSRKRVEETAAWLCTKGLNALPYHAGLSSDLKKHHQHRFLTEDKVIIVATIAFGMGIDKPNVRFVAHLDLPKSIEAYYQETGRAGRDGQPANAWMVYGLQDVVFLRQMVEGSQAPDNIKQVERQKLEAILGLCEITSCRRQVLLGYFGESEHPACGNCDNCLQPVPVWDGTEAARKVLSAVYRTGQSFGVNHIVDVLTGSETEKVKQFGHEKLSIWNIGPELNKQQWRSVFRQLVARSYLGVDYERFGVLRLTEKCRPLLRGEETIELREDLRKKTARTKYDKKKSVQHKLDSQEHILWEALRALRSELAKEQDVPPYIIFHDATLMEMVMYRPTNRTQMQKVSGVGERKLDLYGDQFLAVLNEEPDEQLNVDQQANESITLFKTGMLVSQVASMQKLSVAVIYNHLAAGISRGELTVDEVVELPAQEVQVIEQEIIQSQAVHGLALKPVYEALGGVYELAVIRCVSMGLAHK
ncbi:MAG: DNA helicase RecQ [Pseudomonadales bacterium]|nr:DNA helicase RecQ [Pseudomonadales bacterium]NRA14129.1 DNA helicase RecQ [Oceanospirillaceae bacterium]